MVIVAEQISSTHALHAVLVNSVQFSGISAGFCLFFRGALWIDHWQSNVFEMTSTFSGTNELSLIGISLADLDYNDFVADIQLQLLFLAVCN